MATIIRIADRPHGPHAVAFNFDDLAAQATDHLSRASAEAAEIVAQARREADAIRQQAAEEGRQSAAEAAEQLATEQISPIISALEQATVDLRDSKQAWLAHWESSAVRLAAAMAARIIRRELRRQPQITLALVREALELAAGSPGVRLHLNPSDHKKLESKVRELIDSLAGLGEVEMMADSEVSRGGCLVETRFGAIDQQFESQLKRIEEELTG